jgi:branched-chain amino acid transport system substrate-binding protein
MVSVLPQHTAVLAPALTYECQFPGWSIGPAPNEFIPNQLGGPLRQHGWGGSHGGPGDQRGWLHQLRELRPADVEEPSTSTILPDRGYDIVADVPYPIGNTEWGPIAVTLQDAEPDAVLVMGLGVEANGLIDAMEQLEYSPPMMFALFPAPGPLLGMGEAADGLLSVSMFEPNEPILAGLDPDLREITEEFSARVAMPACPYSAFETQRRRHGTPGPSSSKVSRDPVRSTTRRSATTSMKWSQPALRWTGRVRSGPEQLLAVEQVIKQIQDGDWVVCSPRTEQPPSCGRPEQLANRPR